MPDSDAENQTQDLREARSGFDAALEKNVVKLRIEHGTFAGASIISIFAATKILELEHSFTIYY